MLDAKFDCFKAEVGVSEMWCPLLSFSSCKLQNGNGLSKSFNFVCPAYCLLLSVCNCLPELPERWKSEKLAIACSDNIGSTEIVS